MLLIGSKCQDLFEKIPLKPVFQKVNQESSTHTHSDEESSFLRPKIGSMKRINKCVSIPPMIGQIAKAEEYSKDEAQAINRTKARVDEWMNTHLLYLHSSGEIKSVKEFSKDVIGKKNRSQNNLLLDQYHQKGLAQALGIKDYTDFETVQFRLFIQFLTCLWQIDF